MRNRVNLNWESQVNDDFDEEQRGGTEKNVKYATD